MNGLVVGRPVEERRPEGVVRRKLLLIESFYGEARSQPCILSVSLLLACTSYPISCKWSPKSMLFESF